MRDGMKINAPAEWEAFQKAKADAEDAERAYRAAEAVWHAKRRAASDAESAWIRAEVNAGGQQEPRKPAPPQPKPEWLRKAGRGLDGGERLVCAYEGKTHALVKIPGRKGWECLGRRSYHPTAFFILRKGEALLDSPIKRVHEGRMKTTKLAALVEEIARLDAKDAALRS